MILLNLIQNPVGYLAVLGAFAAVAGVLAVMPIRGGTGQHAGAGPGAVMVWQLSEALEAERTARIASPRIPAVSIETADDPHSPVPQNSAISTETAGDAPPEEEIRWPEEPVAEYVGRHRLWWDIDVHPQPPIDIWLGSRFPWSGPVRTFCCHSNTKYARVPSGGTGR